MAEINKCQYVKKAYQNYTKYTYSDIVWKKVGYQDTK